MRVVVSDHAVVRYMERVKKADFWPVREEILNICEEAALTGAASVTIDGFTYKFSKEGAVVIVVTVQKPDPIQNSRPKPREKGVSGKSQRPEWSTPLQQRKAIQRRKNGRGNAHA